MSAQSATRAARRLAEARMTDTCTIAAVVGEATDSSGKVTPTLGSALYTGRCRVQTFEPHEATSEVGGGQMTVQRYAVHVPVAASSSAYRPAVGHVVTITAAALDPHLVGRQYRVVALLHKSQASAYRLSVEELV